MAEPDERRRPTCAPIASTEAESCPPASPSGANCGDTEYEARGAHGYGGETPDLDAREAGRSSNRKAAGPIKQSPGTPTGERMTATAPETRVHDEPQ